jgi:hypothetical protein
MKAAFTDRIAGLRHTFDTIKQILEEHVINPEITEIITKITADFIQDRSKEWFFVNLVGFKKIIGIQRKSRSPRRRS